MNIDPAEAVYAFVRTVPRGKVVTYGQVADMVEGVSLTARQVGQMTIQVQDIRAGSVKGIVESGSGSGSGRNDGSGTAGAAD